MERFLGRYEPYLYALLRIVAGFLFFLHGTQKLLGMPPGKGMPVSPASFPGGITGLLELVLGLMIMLGLLTSIAAFIASGEMAFAYFMAHFSAAAPLPLQNGGEPPVLFCFIFLYMASRGSGPISLDSLLFRLGLRRT
ncbi:MAG: DoxX family protein [Pyrinomonadaceae bacterium]|nr:DoxX family protein [Pyrinomonadaceae bacterium]